MSVEMPFSQMRPHDYQEGRLRPSVIIRPKLDGLRVHYFEGEFYSKRGELLHGMDHQKSALGSSQRRLKHIDTEATVLGEDFDTASGIIRSKEDPRKVNIILNVIDLPLVPSELVTRMSLSDKMFGRGLGCWRHIPHQIVHSTADVNMWYHIFLNDGHEGMVIGDPWSRYVDCGNTRRSWGWMRRKPTKQFDGVITGFVEGKGKYERSLGAIIVKRESRGESDIKIGGGKLNDKQRRHIFKNQEVYIGRTVEVTYQRRTAKGGYRHPRWERLRAD